MIWLRQGLLLFIASVGSEVIDQIDAEKYPSQKVFAQWVQICAALFVLGVASRLQWRLQPYVLHYQNVMESWLLVSAIVLLGCACVYSQLPDETVSARTVLEVWLFVLLLGSLVAAAIYLAIRWRAMRQALARIDLSSVLLAADAKIDAPLIKELERGTIRLLKCSWLLDTDDAALRRHQDLPSEAFVSPVEASKMIRRGDRSVIALSYGWLTPDHPE